MYVDDCSPKLANYLSNSRCLHFLGILFSIIFFSFKKKNG